MSETVIRVPAVPLATRALSRAALWRFTSGLVILLVWELVVRGFAPAYVAKPTGLTATAITLAAVAQGLLIAVVFGTVIGLLIGRSTVADRMLRHYVNGFYAVPMVVVLPLVSLWFGYTGAACLATIVFAAVFAIIINVADGARSVPREFIEVARSFRSDRVRMLIEIVLPAATPYFLAGLRLAAGRALIGAVVAEFFTAIGGLGYFILYKSRTFRHDEAFVGVLLLAGFGVGFDMLTAWCTRRFLPWYRRDERTE